MNVQTISNNDAVKATSLKRVLRVTTAVGATVLLFMLLWRIYHIYQLSVDNIYQQSYVPYKIAKGPIADTTMFTTIELFFAESDFKEVTRLSKGLLSVTDRERLLIGIAYLQKEEYLPAISWLKRLADVKGTPYQEAAEFYLTLTHLRNEDYDRTIELMQQITNDKSHPYRQQFTQRMIKEVGLLKWK